MTKKELLVEIERLQRSIHEIAEISHTLNSQLARSRKECLRLSRDKVERAEVRAKIHTTFDQLGCFSVSSFEYFLGNLTLRSFPEDVRGVKINGRWYSPAPSPLEDFLEEDWEKLGGGK